MNIDITARLDDGELLERVKCSVETERQATAALVVHLAEVEKRQLHLAEGYRSLFNYCTQGLHLSEHAAYNRIEAARAVNRFPAIAARLACGDVHLTAVKLLAAVLTPENHHKLLDAARHKSKIEIHELVARLRPRVDEPASVRKAPARNATAATGASGPISDATEDRHSATVIPIAAERYRVQFTASASAYDKLRRAQALLRHQIPSGDLGEILARALDVLVRELEKKKFAAMDRPYPSKRRTARGSRHIPAAVKRSVWQRDEGRCTFVGRDGSRCTERGQLEFDHRWPYADGGEPTEENVRLLCARHNQYEAQQFFGPWTADRERKSLRRHGS